jgi:2-oxo-4-hydroxy-4-carboxy-5-ureidoimidazoline decarboxylase
MKKESLRGLNGLDRAGFITACGPLFEGSAWIAERAWQHRPFASLDELHAALVAAMNEASREEHLALIRAHPDLVGRLAREGRLTAASLSEQQAAGLDSLSAAEVALFDSWNAAYKEKFGFPFVICARENRKEAILAAFPARLAHAREEEIGAALKEIGAIARHRLVDRVEEG